MAKKPKTMEDWFLRGGERPDADGAHGNPDARGGEPPEDGPGRTCQSCGENLARDTRALLHCIKLADECRGDDDGEEEVPRDWIVTMSRTRSVQQTVKVRVKARNEGEALDLAEDEAEVEAEDWPWRNVDYTEEHDGVEAVEAEVAP